MIIHFYFSEASIPPSVPSSIILLSFLAWQGIEPIPPPPQHQLRHLSSLLSNSSSMPVALYCPDQRGWTRRRGYGRRHSLNGWCSITLAAPPDRLAGPDGFCAVQRGQVVVVATRLSADGRDQRATSPTTVLQQGRRLANPRELATAVSQAVPGGQH